MYTASMLHDFKKTAKTALAVWMVLFLAASLLFIGSTAEGARSAYRSSQLRKVTVNDGSAERTDYYDDDGKITIAADLGYATAVITKTENGTLEKYYDGQGEPISRYLNYYAILREFDDRGNNIRTTYLDAKEKPMMMGNGYAAEERTYNEKGQVTAVRYFDSNGQPVSTPSTGFGKINEYDEDGRACRITFIDASGAPMKTKQGYAIVSRSFYASEGKENGKVENEFYFDENSRPVSLSLGQFGVHKGYDENGKENAWTYLDAAGRPIVTSKGYTTVVHTFHSDNSVASERYFDIAGNPFSLSEGQYGIKWDNGQTTYLNEKGKEIFNIKNLLYNQSWTVIVFAAIIILLSALIGRRLNFVLLTVYLITIAYMTLILRESGKTKISLHLFWSYRQMFSDSKMRAEILKNIWLFIPLGAILFRLCPKPRILLAPIALSVLIEAIQYFSGIGLCELDDVISNSLGGLIGFGMAKLLLDCKCVLRSGRI